MQAIAQKLGADVPALGLDWIDDLFWLDERRMEADAACNRRNRQSGGIELPDDLAELIDG